MKKFFYTGVLTLLFVSAMALGVPAPGVTKVVFQLDNLAVNADFTAADPPLIYPCGTLNWTQGAIAAVYTTDPMTPFVFLYPDVVAVFTNATDTSADGLASAVFGNLNFSVDLYAESSKTTLLGSLAGTLYGSFKYNEYEIYEDDSGTVLDGAAVIKLTSFNVDGYSWIENLGDPAGMTSETSLSVRIDDYQSDWSSNNVIVTILADESGIPEPATMLLLAIGGLLLRKR